MQFDDSNGRRRWSALPYLVLIVPCWLVLTWPWWSGEVTVPWDVKAHFYPQLQFLARSLSTGESPFWTPNVFSGWGQIADPQSLIFVPAFLLLALVVPDPTFIAMDMTVFGALLAGGMALILWFRDRGWHPAGAVTAALAFAWGASAYWRVQHTGQVVSYGLLPIVIFLLDRALDRRSFLYGLLAGIFAGFLVIGRDQIALISIYILIGQVIAFMAGRGSIGGAVRPLIGGAIGGLMVVTVPVGLTWLLAQNSNRPEIDFTGAGRGSLHPAALITAYIADLFGQGAQDVDYWGPPSAAFHVTSEYLAQNMPVLYSGALPALAILLIGIAGRELLRRDVLVLTIGAIVTLIYAFGWYTPGFRLIYDYLPGVKLYRRPADATFLIGFYIAVLGGYLVHLYVAREDQEPDAAARLLQWGGLAGVLLLAPLLLAWHANRMAEAVLPWGIGLATALGSLITLKLARRAADGTAFVAAALVAVAMTTDLAVNNRPNESTAYSPEIYDVLKRDTKNPTIAFLKDRSRAERTGQRRDRIELVGHGFHWPNASLVHDLENTLGYNPLRFRDYQLATGAHDHVGLTEQREFSKLMPGYDSLMADLLGLRYIAISKPLAAVDTVSDPARLPLVAEFKGDPKVWLEPSYIYENPRALPRVMFVTEARPADFGQIIATGQWPDGYDPHTAVLLERPAALPSTGAFSAATLASSAAITAYHNTEVTVSVDAPAAGYVVLHDIWHPWWTVTIDGRPAELLRADVLFRAVAVTAGRHELRFRYAPLSGALADYRRLLGL